MTAALGAPAHRYYLFGLTIDSDIGLPELVQGDPDRKADVRVSKGPIDFGRDLEEGVHAVDDGMMLVVPDVARFFVSGGSTILVDAEAEVPAENVRVFLLGSAFGLLLHQRGILPLHANAVVIDGHAYVFMAESGGGKSTLAAWFQDQGYALLTDDVAAIGRNDAGNPVVFPGVMRLRLWRDALEASGRDTVDFRRSFKGETTYEKYDVPVSETAKADRAYALGGIYILNRGDSFRIQAIHGVDAVHALFEHSYRGGFVYDVGAEREHFSECVRIAKSIMIHEVFFTGRLEALADEALSVIGHLSDKDD
ncbi:hypothetical protein H8M03_03410 [Sphingomonas sabuli]|uniref:Serine kinase n=1 Tax=Sphingomonas sabuli TaxID=2764186 RepID=A0A7G9L453_9SPHN|nr:hypothetical protein [Sphingomonas sabuli]QNM83402.1 hypothetical protein H8M03_03410 [Sphingomonas sabuli]